MYVFGSYSLPNPTLMQGKPQCKHTKQQRAFSVKPHHNIETHLCQANIYRKSLALKQTTIGIVGLSQVTKIYDRRLPHLPVGRLINCSII